MARKRIFIGLGNPGKEYENTYHNAGLLAVDQLADAPFKKHKGLFEYTTAPDAVFIRPLTYMNESGSAAREALKKFNARAEDLTVIHDESDLPLGTFKVSKGRGAAGHKGVQSIIDALGTNEFTRIRIGIRDPRERRRKKAGEFALARIAARDRAALQAVFKKIPAALGEDHS